MGETLTKFTAGFKHIVDDHLKRLGYEPGSQTVLASLTGISGGQISDWMKGKRLPGRDRICEICFGFAQAYKEKREELKRAKRDVPPELTDIGPETLDGMLNEMLEAVGYSPAIGAKSRPDQIWQRLTGGEEKKLTVAWVDYPPFAYPVGVGCRGVAVDIMERVAKLMGVRITWEKREWPNVITDLINRKVDLVAPLLAELPSRMFEIAFTSAIPGVAVGISGVVNRASEPQIKTNGACLNYVEGEAGEAVCTLFAPDAPARHGHESFEQAWQYIRDNGQDADNRVNCLIADSIICEDLEASTRGILRKIESSDVGGAETVKLPIAAGIHLQERQLLHVLNACLKLLQDTKWFEKYWQEEGDGNRLMEILKRPPPAPRLPTETPAKRQGKAVKTGRNS